MYCTIKDGSTVSTHSQSSTDYLLLKKDLKTFLKKPIERPSSTASATTREGDGITRLENGYCVVLNQEKYDSESDVAFMHGAKSYRPRTGTEHDVCALKRVFRNKFGCKFVVYNDLSADQIIDTFR